MLALEVFLFLLMSIIMQTKVVAGGELYCTNIPFRRGLSLARILLKSGRSSGFSAQHSFRQSLTKSKLFSKASSGGLKISS
jgi:hypothetical protein